MLFSSCWVFKKFFTWFGYKSHQICICNYFFQSVASLYIVLYRVFFFIMKSSLTGFFPCRSYSQGHIQKVIIKPTFSSGLSFRIFIVLNFTFRYTFHSELIFVQSVNLDFIFRLIFFFFFLLLNIQLLQHWGLRTMLFLIGISFVTCQRSVPIFVWVNL